MNYKALILSLLSIASYNVYSMEAIIKPAKVQKISRCERKLNEILVELKASNNGQLKIDWQALERIMNKILQYISHNSHYKRGFYLRLKWIDQKLKAIDDIVVKEEIFINFIFSIFTMGLFELIDNNSAIGAVDSAGNSYKSISEKLFPKLIDKLMYEDIDLFDNLLLYAQENKLDQFEHDFFKFTDIKDLDENIASLIGQADLISLTELVEKNYNDIIRLNLINKLYTFGINKITILDLLLQHILRSNPNQSSSSTVNLRNLVLKLINETQLSIAILIKLKKELNYKIDQINKDAIYKKLAGFNLESAQFYLEQIALTIKVKVFTEKLFEAVINKDIDRTRIYAFALASLNADFQNSTGDTPLHEAVLLKNKELIITLLGVCPRLIDIKNNNGQTPISLAAKDKEALRLIFDIANTCLDQSAKTNNDAFQANSQPIICVII